MAFDLFISHSRRDDLDGRITQLIEHLNREFEKIHGRELKVFFDTAEVRSWDEWRERILPGVQESRLFLAYVSTSYIESDHSEWDLNEYLKREIARGLTGDGIVVVDTIDWARWDEGTPKRNFFPRFRELSRRRIFDFRGELKKTEPLNQLASQIARLIRLIERSDDSPGNIDPFNPHFTGRSSELAYMRESLALERLCVLSGPPGIGKTALAVEYAHAFAGEYAGGRWQVSCQGERNLFDLIDSPNLHELRKRVSTRDKRCLLILDEFTEPDLLMPTEILLNVGDWLHVILTTRFSKQHFSPREHDLSLLTLQGLPAADAIQLIESFQLKSEFDLTYPRNREQRIASLVDGFPLAIEAIAASARHSRYLRHDDFIDPLWKARRDHAREDQARIVRALLKPIVSPLSDAEILALRFASRFDKPVELSSIRRELVWESMEFRDDERPGYPSSWQTLLNNLVSVRLWRPTNEVNANGELRTVRMHPLWQQSIEQLLGVPPPRREERTEYARRPASIPPVRSKPPASAPPAPLTPPAIPPAAYEEPLERLNKESVQSSDRTVVISGDDNQIRRNETSRAPHPLDEDVMFTVYRRKTIAPNKWYPLLAFAHLSERRSDAPPDEPDPIAEVNHQAKAILGAAIVAFKQSTEDSGQPIPRSGELMFKPSVPGVEFNPPSRTFKWEEPVHREEFKMRATTELEGQVTRGYLRVFLGPIIVAEVNLAFKVDSTAGAADIGPDLMDGARPFRKVFASYSHKDTEIVEHIEKLVHETRLGLEYLRDVTKLRSGDVWDPSLLQMIDTADLFQLFWSTNSMSSDYVRREYEHALGRQLPDFVRPVYWEKPFPERPAEGLPPEALKRLHFEKLSISEALRVPSAPPRPTIRPTQHCPRCGSNFDTDQEFCLNCGSSLRRNVIAGQRREYEPSRETGKSIREDFDVFWERRERSADKLSADRSFDYSGEPAYRRVSSPLTGIYAAVVGSTLLEVVLLLLFFALRYFGRDPRILLWLLIGCSIVFAISWIIAIIIEIRDR